MIDRSDGTHPITTVQENNVTHCCQVVCTHENRKSHYRSSCLEKNKNIEAENSYNVEKQKHCVFVQSVISVYLEGMYHLSGNFFLFPHSTNHENKRVHVTVSKSIIQWHFKISVDTCGCHRHVLKLTYRFVTSSDIFTLSRMNRSNKYIILTMPREK